MLLRRLSLAAAAAVFSLGAFGANVHPDLPEVKRVYLLSMTNGLDQYLAQRLTKVGRFEVVTDPNDADAIFTDRLGPSFEDRWEQLYPPPPPPPEEAEAKAKAEKAAKSKKDKESSEGSGFFSGDVSAQPLTRVSSFSRGRGNVFIVSRKSKAVLWSHFTTAKDTRPKTMDRTADDIVDQLQDDLKPKK